MRAFPKGLRARTAISFALLALMLSVTLSVVTYQLVRWYLLDQREGLATRQAMINALVAKELVATTGPASDTIMTSLGAVSNARSVLRVNGTWHAAVVDLSEARIPSDLIKAVDATGPARQRVTVSGIPYVVVGTRLPGLDAAYFEFVPLTEYQRTLATLGTALALAASITTVGGAAAGWLASRRVMRPLASVAVAAQAMSDGDLSRRLEVGHDPDLAPVASSFNGMATSLQQRIERELRFTADVSHELRTPITAMTSAVALAQRAELPERARFAVTVLGEQVDHMRRLTLDLLEISRIDAGRDTLRLEDVDMTELAGRVLAGADVDASKLRCTAGDLSELRLDETRVERIIANLVENANRYGGGVSALEISTRENDLVIVVDDDGPGVRPEERTAIFGRFHRGSVEQAAGFPKGTGLGLALVEEHARLHGGSVHVTDSPSGGARFIVRLPVQT